MTAKKFEQKMKEFCDKINGFDSIIKIIRRKPGEGYRDGVAFFEVHLDIHDNDPFISSSCPINVTTNFVRICEKEAKRILGVKKSPINWNNTRCILWMYNEKKE